MPRSSKAIVLLSVSETGYVINPAFMKSLRPETLQAVLSELQGGETVILKKTRKPKFTEDTPAAE